MGWVGFDLGVITHPYKSVKTTINTHLRLTIFFDKTYIAKGET